MDGARGRRLEVRERLAPRFFVGCAIQELQLEAERGQWGTQLVSGIGDESALRLERLIQAHQQPVQLIHQGRNLLRQPGGGDRRQAVHVAPLHLARHAPQRPKPRAHDADDGGAQQRQQQEQRNHHPECGSARQALAHLDGLGDLDHPLNRLQPVGAPRLAADGHIGVAQGRCIDQRQPGTRKINPGPINVPYLNHEITLVRRQFESRRHGDLASERQRHLAQLIIEQDRGLRQNTSIGQQTGEHRDDGHEGQQRNQQSGAQGPHACCSFGTK